MTDDDYSNAVFALGSKYPQWALCGMDEGIRALKSEKGAAYLREHLPNWVPPSERDKP